MRVALAALLLLVATAALPATESNDKGKDAFQGKSQSRDPFRLRGHLEAHKSPKRSMWKERGGFWGQARAMWSPRSIWTRRGIRDDDRDGIPNRFDSDDDNDGTTDDLDLSDY